MSAGHEAFESLVGELDYPMFIVTAADRGDRDGCLVAFATQCSIRPPRFLAPVLARCPNWFAGAILNRVRLGDHVGFLLEPIAGQHGAAGLAAFPFSRAKHVHAGHEP